MAHYWSGVLPPAICGMRGYWSSKDSQSNYCVRNTWNCRHQKSKMSSATSLSHNLSKQTTDCRQQKNLIISTNRLVVIVENTQLMRTTDGIVWIWESRSTNWTLCEKMRKLPLGKVLKDVAGGSRGRETRTPLEDRVEEDQSSLLSPVDWREVLIGLYSNKRWARMPLP